MFEVIIFVCNICLQECFVCARCEVQLAGQKFAAREDAPYCAHCFGELFAKRCAACSRPITGQGGTRYLDSEGCLEY